MQNKWQICTLVRAGIFCGTTLTSCKANIQLRTIIFKWLHIKQVYWQDFHQDLFAYAWICKAKQLRSWQDLLKQWELLSKYKTIYSIFKENSLLKPKATMEKTFMKVKSHWWSYITLIMDNNRKKKRLL